jgi:hypothetical protein
MDVQIEKDFISKVFKLQELSMQLYILYKENIVWKE